MTNKESERIYEVYKQWQYSRNRFRHECVTYVLIAGIIVFFIISNLKLILVSLAATAVILVALISNAYYRRKKKEKEQKEKLLEVALESGIRIDSINPDGSIVATVLNGDTDNVISSLKDNAAEKGIKMSVKRLEE